MIFTVNTLIDELDGSITDGDISLRDAIAAANAQPGLSTIQFDPLLSGGTIALTLGELRVTGDTIINGDIDDNGTPDITVNAQGNSRVFNISDNESLMDQSIDQDVTLNGLAITGGATSGNFDLDDASGSGGGIFTTEDLTVSNSVISGNSASDSGGGIGTFVIGEGSFLSGDVTLIQSVVTGNTSARGSGIASFNSTSITNSTISDNEATSRFTSGVYLRGLATISNSTISGNEGDGIFSYGGVVISNSTISYNSEDGVSSFSGGSIIQNSTITNNRGSGVSALIGGVGTITSSIVGRNGRIGNLDIAADLTGQSSESPDLTSGGNNLIGNGEGLTGLADSDIVGTIAAPVRILLGDLQDNGGPTETQAPLPNSPAINAGSNPNGLAFDQRGSGFARDVGGQADIGAFESDLGQSGVAVALSLFDASTDTLIAPVNDNSTIILDGTDSDELNIVASFEEDSPVESVVFNLNNGQIVRTESSEPLALFGDVSGDLTEGVLSPGTNTLRVDLYSENNGQGELLGTAIRTFTISEAPEPAIALELGLFDASTDTLIAPIGDNSSIVLDGTDSDELNIVASFEEDSPVESVVFNLNNGQVIRTESSEPLALFGDIRGDLTEGALTPGTNTLRIDTYSEDNGQGELLSTITRTFTISEPTAGPEVALELFDARTDTLIAPITEGSEINIAGASRNNLSVVASFDEGSPVESVFFNLNNGQATASQSAEPLALFGDLAGDLAGGTIAPGANTLSLDLYSQDGLSGELLASLTRTFTIIDEVTGPSGVEVGLFNADNDTLIQVLEDGDTLRLSELPSNLAVVAGPAAGGPLVGQVGSVSFDLNDGEVRRIESFEPLALFGDVSGDLTGGMFSPGSNRLELDAYSGDRAQGQLLETVDLNFTVV